MAVAPLVTSTDIQLAHSPSLLLLCGSWIFAYNIACVARDGMDGVRSEEGTRVDSVEAGANIN